MIEKTKSVGISINNGSIAVNILSQYVRNFETIGSERLKCNQPLLPLGCSTTSYQIKPVVLRNGDEVVFRRFDDYSSSKTHEYVSNLLGLLGVLHEDERMIV